MSLSEWSFDCIRHASLNHDDENKSVTGFGESPGFTVAWEQTRDALANREPTSLSLLAKRDKLFSGFHNGQSVGYIKVLVKQAHPRRNRGLVMSVLVAQIMTL